MQSASSPAPTSSAGFRLWRPERVLVAKSARDSAVAERAVEVGRSLGSEILWLPGDAVRGIQGETPAETYRRAKKSLAIVNAPPSALKLQPIPPSADFRVDLATGCPGHCQYCYLAGSLSGPPLVRAYANLRQIFSALPQYLGQGRVTSRNATRMEEGTTFEASCYTDPLGIEHLTGGLSALIEHVGELSDAGADVGLRFTTKYDAVEPLLGLAHRGSTRARFSVNAEPVARAFEAGTAPLGDRLLAMGRMARAGYPVGLTIAPIMPIRDWREHYERLLLQAAAALPPNTDVTVELITHRFTPGSREVLLGWYPGTRLEMEPAVRTEKRNKFGGTKYVYPREQMEELKAWFHAAIGRRLPKARILYWT